jgi:inner membrane component-like transport protein
LRFVLNLIWLVLAGFWLALGYIFAGILAFILIITIPFGIAAWRIAFFALWPFGRTIVRRPDAGAGSTIGNVVWIIFLGRGSGAGASHHGGRAVRDDHRDPARSGELQADSDLADAARARDRPHAGPRLRAARVAACAAAAS